MPYKKTPASIPQDHKWCFGCSTAKPRQKFGIDRSRKDGRRYCCLSCAGRKEREAADRRRMFNSLFRKSRGAA